MTLLQERMKKLSAIDEADNASEALEAFTTITDDLYIGDLSEDARTSIQACSAMLRKLAMLLSNVEANND